MTRKRGKVELILGGMKSGKTGELFKQIDRAGYRGLTSCVVRPKTDTREFLARGSEFDYTEIWVNEIADEIGWISSFDIVCVDEGQFISDLGTSCHKLALNGNEVYVAALSGDTDLLEWKSVSGAIPYADKIKVVHAVCEDCHSDAVFTYTDAKKDGQVLIGDVQFKALCRECYEKRRSMRN